MKEFYFSAGRFFFVLASIPFLVELIGAYSAGLGFLLFITAIPVAMIVLLVGAAIWQIRGVRAAREVTELHERAGLIAASPVLLLLTILVSWPLRSAGGFLGDLSRLAINHKEYGAIIADAQSSGEEAWFEESRGITYSVDRGPPVRVAFNPAGMLDNWSAIIFDPTGEMLEADGFDAATGKFTAADRITKLFGGDLVGCSRLWGDYYRCSFT